MGFAHIYITEIQAEEQTANKYEAKEGKRDIDSIIHGGQPKMIYRSQ